MKDDNVVLVIGVILAVYLALLLIIKIVRAVLKFNRKLQYITEELQRAGDDEEYRYWRRELRCHYLRLLPFVGRYNVRRVYYALYHRSEKKGADRSDGIFHILAPSVIGIAVCAFCLCGASWAWFTATTSTGTAAIQTATYGVTVTAKQDDSKAKTEAKDGITTVTFEDAGAYTVTLTPKADNTAKEGYCKVEFGDKAYYTASLTKGKLTFTVNAEKDSALTVTPQWGSYSGEATLESKDQLGKATKAAKESASKTEPTTAAKADSGTTEPTTAKSAGEPTTAAKKEETTAKKTEEEPDTPTTAQAEEVSKNQ